VAGHNRSVQSAFETSLRQVELLYRIDTQWLDARPNESSENSLGHPSPTCSVPLPDGTNIMVSSSLNRT
jgi:hypothetical protein